MQAVFNVPVWMEPRLSDYIDSMVRLRERGLEGHVQETLLHCDRERTKELVELVGFLTADWLKLLPKGWI